MPAVPVPGWTYPSNHDNEGVGAIFACLERWFDMMQRGEAHLWQPDPIYVRRGGKPIWTEQELDDLVKDIDAEIQQEVNRVPGTQMQATDNSGFWRLAVPQRLALAQQLEQVIEAHREELKLYQPAVSE